MATDSGLPFAVTAVIAAPTLALLMAALALGLPGLVPWAIAVLGAEYGASLHGDAGVDGRAPVVGAVLVLVAELSYWSLERRTRIGDERGLYARRAVTVLALSAAAAGLGTVLLLLSAAPLGGGTGAEVVGIAAAAGSIALLALLARRA